MQQTALAFLIGAALPLIPCAAPPTRAQEASACAAYPRDSTAYTECAWRAYEARQDSAWWLEMDRRARLEYRAGE